MKNLTILLFLILLVGCKSECVKEAVSTLEDPATIEAKETLIEKAKAVEQVEQVLPEVEETIEKVVPEMLEPEVKPTEEVPVKELTDEEIEKIF